MKKIAILRQRFSDPQAVAISLATIRKKRIDFWKRTKVDATAFIIFGVITGFVTIIYEVIISALICGVEIKAIFLASLLYIGDNFLFGWFFGYVLDKTRAYFTKKEK